MELQDPPEDSKIIPSKDQTVSDGSRYITFHHIDGMYSYCTTEKGAVVHLSVMTPLIKQSDGSYNIADEHQDN